MDLDGLHELYEFPHLNVMYMIPCASNLPLRVKTIPDEQVREVFSTRHLCQPIPICICEIALKPDGVDVINGTITFDIRPFLPEFNLRIE